jgi:hypothetical protein
MREVENWAATPDGAATATEVFRLRDAMRAAGEVPAIVTVLETTKVPKGEP